MGSDWQLHSQWTIGGEKEQDSAGVFALPGLLPIYGLAINGPTRGQRHLSITNGTFALTVNALEAIWFNCSLLRNKGQDQETSNQCQVYFKYNK